MGNWEWTKEARNVQMFNSGHWFLRYQMVYCAKQSVPNNEELTIQLNQWKGGYCVILTRYFCYSIELRRKRCRYSAKEFQRVNVSISPIWLLSQHFSICFIHLPEKPSCFGTWLWIPLNMSNGKHTLWTVEEEDNIQEWMSRHQHLSWTGKRKEYFRQTGKLRSISSLRSKLE